MPLVLSVYMSKTGCFQDRFLAVEEIEHWGGVLDFFRERRRGTLVGVNEVEGASSSLPFLRRIAFLDFPVIVELDVPTAMASPSPSSEV